MHRLRLDFGETKIAAQLALSKEPDLPLRDFLARFAVRSAEPLPDAWLDLPLRDFTITPVSLGETAAHAPAAGGTLRQHLDRLYHEAKAEEDAPAPAHVPMPTPAPATPAHHYPVALTDSEAVNRAYASEIEQIGRYLSNDLAVLVVCDKALAEHIYRHAVKHSNKRAMLEGDAATSEPGSTSHTEEGSLLQRDMAPSSRRVAGIGRLLAGIKPDQVLVLTHLDVLAGGASNGAGTPLTPEARMLTEVLYRSQEFTPTLLGFSDPSIGLPKVLMDRFAVRVELAGLSRDAMPALVTRAEYERFDHFDHEMLFKNVSGFNALQFRNAMRYLCASSQPATPATRLMHLIREFKQGSGDAVEIPDITFDQIGGYVEVKQSLFDAIELITGRMPPFHADGTPYHPSPADLNPPAESEAARSQRRKLAPRGFIFHGPPGTGKTLFAKAIANAMNATIQMVSGPEIMDMWVGKSESNLRHIFSIARRNAPAVIFFDEFDSIAMQRSGAGDGASRASNAVVAQLLTELDGFHDDQDILVIGTTNRLDIIDEALVRPSRFQPVEIDLPDEQARRQIAAIHARTFDIAIPDPAWLDTIARHTDGFNGDEIRAIFQQVAREARKGTPITQEGFQRQVEFLRMRRNERHNAWHV